MSPDALETLVAMIAGTGARLPVLPVLLVVLLVMYELSVELNGSTFRVLTLLIRGWTLVWKERRENTNVSASTHRQDRTRTVESWVLPQSKEFVYHHGTQELKREMEDFICRDGILVAD